jgi:dihydromonapterin reductase/dihydrofolate reductase
MEITMGKKPFANSYHRRWSSYRPRRRMALSNQKQPVIVSYRTHYPAIDGLREAGAICIPADFSTDEGVLAFADEVKAQTDGLRAIVHNASAWLAEKPGTPLTDVLSAMMQIHVNTPYLLNHALEGLLRGHGHAASDIIHFTDYVVERGSDKHIAYAASKAALDNMTRSFAQTGTGSESERDRPFTYPV